MDRQAAQQRAGAAMAARNRDREAMRYETGLARSGVLSLRRGRMTELFRFEQSLRDEGLPQEDVQRHLADYNEYLNEAAVRDFETEKADRLINAARQAAYQIENVLSQGLVSAAAHGTQGFEQFFHSIGQMAQQTAAEILKVMVIRPMMAWGLQSMGLGSLAAELGLAALTMHSGGVVGSDGYVRMVPASLIAGAPRYHSGTASAGGPATGLAPNEVLTILKKGEQVIPEGGSAGSLNVVNNISINNNGPGTQNEAASEQMAKTIIKQIDIYMEKKMSSFVVRQMRHNGLFN